MKNRPKVDRPADVLLVSLEGLERGVREQAIRADLDGLPQLHDDLTYLWIALVRIQSRLGAKGSRYSTIWPREDMQLQLSL